MNSIANLTPRQLRNAAELQERILALQHEVESLLSGGATASESSGKRYISPAGLARIRAAQKRRWAKAGGAKGKGVSSRKGKSTMSATGRARIAAALKARWARAKRAGRNAL
jgi:hypothetical protein